MIADDELDELVKSFLRNENICSPCWAERPQAANLEEAIEIAALSRDVRGKKHPHQWRIPDAVLNQLCGMILDDIYSIGESGNFCALHDRICFHCSTIRGAGELLAYDVAFRIGLYLGIEPDLVYLHAGTRVGARKLGIRGKAVPLSKFPRPLHSLRPCQVEDFLCLYKDRL